MNYNQIRSEKNYQRVVPTKSSSQDDLLMDSFELSRKRKLPHHITPPDTKTDGKPQSEFQFLIDISLQSQLRSSSPHLRCTYKSPTELFKLLLLGPHPHPHPHTHTHTQWNQHLSEQAQALPILKAPQVIGVCKAASRQFHYLWFKIQANRIQ